jgi:UDP-N-acetylglucosamine--N-acetylmuramyl-(pentapeptide) pyrophosphoryl-undecaprenol N-acetylglucosamine transferase
VELGVKLSAGNSFMRVYFAPCGIGLGHVGRCIPIARKLLEKKGDVIFSTYREGVGYVKQENFPLIEAPPIGFQVKTDGTVDFRQTAVNPGPFFASFTFSKQINAEIQTIESFDPDVVVSDSRMSSILAARILGIPRICILNQFQVIIPRKNRFLNLAKFADSVTLTIVGKMWTSGNLVLIPDFPKPYTICTGNLTIPKSYRKNVRLIGPILPVHPNALPTEKELREKLRLSIDKPVIFAPISGPVKEKAFLIGILRKILLEFPDDYEVVISLGYPNAGNEPVHHDNVTIYKWVPNRFEYLKACDLVIGRAGHGTITQCMSYGKPMILVPTPSHTEQLSNSKQAENLGVAKTIQQEELSKEKLLKSVQQLLESKVHERLKEVQKETLKHDGLENAVKTIIEMAEHKQVF